MLGTTLGAKTKGKKYSAAALTAFGEDLTVNSSEAASRSPFPVPHSPFFTGKPYVAGLGHAFLFRNYRAGLAKWQTADPLGYPDGWNQLAYCGNGALMAVDLWGGELKIVDRDTEDAPPVMHDMGMHVHDGRKCHWHIIDEYVYDITIMQDFARKRRWETIDGLEDVLNGIGFCLDISGGLLSFTVVGSIPAGGVVLWGIVFHAAAEILDNLNGWIDVPVGERIRVRNDSPRCVGSFELHIFE